MGIEDLILKTRKIEFESRIFVSLAIVLVFCLLSFVVFNAMPNSLETIGSWLGFSNSGSLLIGYSMVAGLLLFSTLLRMWAGSCLTSKRVMSFKVQKDQLNLKGPYQLVRNPIYSADLIAMFAFSLCLHPVTLAMPLLFYLHYIQLVKYEEVSLEQQFGDSFRLYRNSVPRFIPNYSGLRMFPPAIKEIHINFDGFRHNALYLLFIPGFILAAFTGNLLLAIIFGLPAVIDWAIVHTFIGIKPNTDVAEHKHLKKNEIELAKSKVFEDILYAQCWEDPNADREAFQVSAGDTIFSITSGGCNVLAFLLDNPDKIIALDLNRSQNCLLELKMAAFQRLSYTKVLEFLGVEASADRKKLYQLLRQNISDDGRDFWDNNLDKIETGIIHCGRYENYMHLLKKWFDRFMGRSIGRRLFESNSKSEREILYRTSWNNLRWRLFTRFFLSRPFMSLLFDRAFFAQLDESFSFGNHFRSIIKRAIFDKPVKENNFLAYILLGNYYSKDHLPVYLRKENFEKIRNRLGRIEMITGNCEEYFKWLPDDYFSKLNFSNIFEWMPEQDFHKLLKETIRVTRNGGVIAYRNLLVPRSRPDSLSKWIKPKKDLSRELHKKDLSFIYNRYVVEEIVK